MSDAQSFYVILAVFYLFDCLKFTPPGAIAFCSQLRRNQAWVPRNPFMRLAGIGKITFLAPLLPWPKVMLAPSNPQLSGPTQYPRNIRRLTRILTKSTADLRWMGMIIFLHFFVAIPIIYFQYRGEIIVLAMVGLGYLMLWVNATVYYSLHKRFLPMEKTDRFKNTLYTALLPWHSMRCSDEILIQYSLPWCKLAFLTTHIDHPANKTYLQTLWRKAHYHPSPEYSLEVMSKVFNEENIDIKKWLTAPELNDGSTLYCPCCQLGYSQPTSSCADCHDTPLLHQQSEKI